MAVGGGAVWLRFTSEHYNVIEDHNEVSYLFRQFFYARYLDWTLTTPLLILDLAFLAGLNGANIFVAIVADLIMIMTGLFGATSEGSSKWGWYAMAWAGFLVIIYIFFTSGRKSVQNRTNDTKKLFNYLGIFTLILWLGYPIVWILGEGVRKFSVDGEIIAYAILDVLAKPVFGFWLLLSHARLTGQLCLHDGFWNRGLNTAGAVRLGEDDDEA